MQSDEVLDVVCFLAAGHRIAVEARHIAGMRNTAPEKSVAIEALLGLPVDENADRSWLLADSQIVEVGAPVELRALPADSIHRLPEFVAARLQLNGIRALTLSNGGALLVDLRSLLAQDTTPNA